MTSQKPMKANRGPEVPVASSNSGQAKLGRLAWLLLALLVGCHGLSPVEIIKAPDAPMLIREVRGDKAKVAIYDKAGHKLIDAGWVAIPVGYTLHKYDWEKFLEDHRHD